MFDILIPIAFLFIITAIIAYLIMSRPKIGVWGIILVIYLLTYLIGLNMAPRAAKWFIEMSIFFLSLHVLAVKSIQRKKIILPFGLLLLSVILFSLMSSLLNGVNLITFLLGLRLHFKYILLFYLLINLDFKEEFYIKTIKILFLIAIFQIPVTLIQKLVWNPYNTMGYMGRSVAAIDAAGGTFGWGDTTGILACFLSGVVYFLISYMIYNKADLKLIAISALLFVPIFLANSTANLILLPIGLLFLISRTSRRNFIKLIISMMIACVFLSVAYVFIISQPAFKSSKLAADFEIQRMLRTQVKTDASGGPARAGKIASMMYAFDLVKDNLFTLISGLGMGSASSSYFSDFSGSLANKIAKYEMKPQVARTLIEMGFFGITGFFIFIFYIYKINCRLFRITTDKFWKTVYLSFYGIVFLYAASAFYRPVWDTEPTAFAFWFLSAAIYSNFLKVSLVSANSRKID